MYDRADTSTIITFILRAAGYFFLSIAIFMFALHIIGANGMKNAMDLTELTKEEVKTGLFVKGDVVESGGIYASKEVTVDGAVMDAWNYYVISFGEKYDSYMGFFTMLAADEMNRLTAETVDYYDGKSDSVSTTVPITGVVLPITGMYLQYYRMFMEPLPQDTYVEYYITHIDSAMIQRLLVIGCVVLLIGIVLASVAVSVEKKSQGEEYYEKRKKRLIIKTVMFWVELIATVVTIMSVLF